MPDYRFTEIIKEGLRLSAQRTQPSTQKTDSWNAKPLERYFDGYWVTYDPMSKRRKVLVPEKVFRYCQWRREDGVQDSTLRRELAVASKCVKKCRKYLYWQLPNPFEDPPAEQGKPRKRQGTNEEIAALAIAAKQPLQDMIFLMFNAWLRPGECRQLKWSEVQGDRIVLEHQKNGTDMPVALNETAQALISRQPQATEYRFRESQQGQPCSHAKGR